jgi:hypothetical protein
LLAVRARQEKLPYIRRRQNWPPSFRPFQIFFEVGSRGRLTHYRSFKTSAYLRHRCDWGDLAGLVFVRSVYRMTFKLDCNYHVFILWLSISGLHTFLIHCTLAFWFRDWNSTRRLQAEFETRGEALDGTHTCSSRPCP